MAVQFQFLSEMLAYLLGPKGSYAIQAKAKNDSILFPDTHVEGEVLGRNGATIPGVPHGDGRTDQGTITSVGPGLKIEKERCASKQPTLAITQKDRWTPL